MEDFNGVKSAVFFKEQLVVYLRDNKPGLRFANMWDFPGGGREDNETRYETLAREIDEEFTIKITEDQIVWWKQYPAMHDSSQNAYFAVVNIDQEQIDSIQFGSEGQKWRLMPVSEFMELPDAVPLLKQRLQDYLDIK